MLAATIVLAAGGTGGHIFPAEAVATALAQQGHKVIFITDRAGRKFDRLPPSVQVMALPMHRRSNSVVGMVKFAWGIFKSMYHMYRGFKIMRPSIVIGFGGYPSFPAVGVAQGMHIPTILHEQNAVLGQVNRMLVHRASQVGLSFEQTQRVPDGIATAVTGTPVRDAFYAYRDTSYTNPTLNEPIRLLITGGSQGAKVFSTVVPEAIHRLPESIRRRLSILHQCPTGDVEALRTAYGKLGIDAIVVDFIDNMAAEMSAAHLVIGRSGASTLAELTILGRPAILVPFPHAKDDHQMANAQTIVDATAGWVIPQSEFSPTSLAGKLESLLLNPKILYDAAKQMKALGKPMATQHIVNLITTELTKGK